MQIVELLLVAIQLLALKGDLLQQGLPTTREMLQLQSLNEDFCS
jgi:hypothetical protein